MISSASALTFGVFSQFLAQVFGGKSVGFWCSTGVLNDERLKDN
jgi:hypothetical protein